MQVLHVCSEMFPLLKTGGLADVIGALPAAQIADGVDARVLLPAFPDIRRGVTGHFCPNPPQQRKTQYVVGIGK